MGVFVDIMISAGYLGGFIGLFGSALGIWLLIDGLEWFRRQFKFIMNAAEMPGPTALPIIGNSLSFACSHEEMLNRLVTIFKPHVNPCRFWMGPKLFVVLRNPRDIEVVMNSPIATKKPYEYRFLATYLGNGIVTESGTTHRAHRKLIMPMVNGRVLVTYLQESFDKQSRRCVECLEKEVGRGEFEVMQYMDDCTFDVVLETILGTPGTTQAGEYKGLIHRCTEAITLAHERTMKVWLYFDWVYARTKSGKLFAKAMDILHEFADTIIAQKKKELDASNSSYELPNKSTTAVLDQLVSWNAQSKDMDEKSLREQIQNVWMPAQDPTALAGSFMFLMLGMHPEIQEKVRAEVREVLGDGDRDITMEDITKMKYLDMVFKETVRLFPVGPVILREPQEDLDFETCTAPKGCTIAVLLYMTHRDPKYWKEPEKFNPDRFLPENSAGRHPYAFVPFSAGIRGCIGRQYATVLMKTLAARVIQKYRIRSSGSLDTLPLKIGVSIRSINGYKISITKV